MKTIIKIGFFFIAIAIINSCQKENREIVPPVSIIAPKTGNEKSLNINASVTSNDPFLLLAISGANPDYQNIEVLEQLLIENAPLSTVVLTAVINSYRFTDEMVELLSVISAPIGQPTKILLSTARPNLNLFAINQTDVFQNTQKHVIVNTNPKTILLGDNFTRKIVPTAECADCSSEITGAANSIMVNLTSTDDVLQIGGCNSSTQTCGNAARVAGTNSGGTGTTYMVTCLSNPSKVCINGKLTSDR